MPVYSYTCDTCDADLEILHAMDASRTTCGLSCLRRDAGPFGQGTIRRTVSAANVVAQRAVPTAGGASSDGSALRAKALERLGGDRVTEAEIRTAESRGMTVYRHEGGGRYYRDGGDASLPKTIEKPES